MSVLCGISWPDSRVAVTWCYDCVWSIPDGLTHMAPSSSMMAGAIGYWFGLSLFKVLFYFPKSLSLPGVQFMRRLAWALLHGILWHKRAKTKRMRLLKVKAQFLYNIAFVMFCQSKKLIMLEGHIQGHEIRVEWLICSTFVAINTSYPEEGFYHFITVEVNNKLCVFFPLERPSEISSLFLHRNLKVVIQ